MDVSDDWARDAIDFAAKYWQSLAEDGSVAKSVGIADCDSERALEAFTRIFGSVEAALACSADDALARYARERRWRPLEPWRLLVENGQLHTLLASEAAVSEAALNDPTRWQFVPRWRFALVELSRHSQNAYASAEAREAIAAFAVAAAASIDQRITRHEGSCSV